MAEILDPELQTPAPRKVRPDRSSGEAGPILMQALLGFILLPLFWGALAGIQSMGLNLGSVAFMAGVLLLTMFVEYRIWHGHLRQKRLVVEGVAVEGCLVDKQFRSSGKGRICSATYAYDSDQGLVRRQARISSRHYDSFAVGDRITILCDPKTGEDVVYRLTPFRALRQIEQAK